MGLRWRRQNLTEKITLKPEIEKRTKNLWKGNNTIYIIIYNREKD